jgi:hypothetical protein
MWIELAGGRKRPQEALQGFNAVWIIVEPAGRYERLGERVGLIFGDGADDHAASFALR